MVILEKIINNKKDILEVPFEWQYPNMENFGSDWKLFDYQKKALDNIINTLFLTYKRFGDGKIMENRKKLLKYYQEEGLDNNLRDSLSIKKKNENFKFLAEYYKAEDNKIDFRNFLNRVSFWMATGSGKTLVMIKLLAILGNLMNKKLIPKKDVLILAPKEDILNQIKKHVDKFNKGHEIKIKMWNLKQWERVKNQQALINKNEINVFYYRADVIGDKDTVAKKKEGQRIDHNSIYNNGNWYLILDEAHKGEKETSKRQQYFIALTHNGFLFNFSATFTDELDKVTTVFDYKLDTFLGEGYGKKIYVPDSNFASFTRGDELSENDQRDIISQTLILFSLIKKRSNKLKKINKKLYHHPLLITLANSVNIEDADLKVFYTQLAEIARGNFDFKAAKKNLAVKIENNNKYLFQLGELDASLAGEIRNLTEQEFFKQIFNSKNRSNIEVVKFKNNTRELAFKLKNTDKYFMLIVASDIVRWEDNVLDGYEFGKVIDDSFFENIDDRGDVNILLGSRIFVEGWDTNRPNIINFINIGVSEEAKKFVLQSIGRGIRIEPLKNQRKRFENINKGSLSSERINQISRVNGLMESIFIFATNKEVVKNILKDLQDQAESGWITIKDIKKNASINEKELPIFIPIFKDGVLNDRPFWVGKKEKITISDYVNNISPKVLLLKNGIKTRTINKLKSPKYLKAVDKRRKKSVENILLIADSFFNDKTKKIDKIKILDSEISHYKEVKTSLSKDEVKTLTVEVAEILKPRQTEEEIDKLFDEGTIDKRRYKELIKDSSKARSGFEVIGNRVDFSLLREHYYAPILHRKNTKYFQHIIKTESEIDFIKDLIEYLEKNNNTLKKYDWWYFSKLDEAIDAVSIPYFCEDAGGYRSFNPDFIFWLKKNDKYYIKFIDPKGVEHTKNPIEKICGFEEFKEDYNKIKEKKVASFELFYYNDDQPEAEEVYKKYWTNDFEKIFAC
ncbi:DEAD/DEAH box helicase family protein [Patescibacteria group bacterium AH-259-L07]|nr:DEAD/DEAH box helicase family protein [Patescibacteria group bacterium AH-259-L07]